MARGLDEELPKNYDYCLTEAGAMIACITRSLRAGAVAELSHEDCQGGKTFVDLLQDAWEGPDNFLKFALKTAFSVEEKADEETGLKRVVRCHLPDELEEWVCGDWYSRWSVIGALVQGWSSELLEAVKEKGFRWLF